MMWAWDIDLTLLSYSFSHIDVKVCNGEGSGSWRFTRFYANPVTNRKKSLGNYFVILRINTISHGFVQVNLMKFLGGNRRTVWQIEQSREVVSECQLGDLLI